MNDDHRDDSRMTGMPEKPSGSSKEWALIEKMLSTGQREQRASRRWSIFFKLLTFVYLFVLVGVFSGGELGDSSVAGKHQPHTALVDIKGTIMPDGDVTSEHVIKSLKQAFDEKNAVAVLLRINSPGGTPVQAGSIYREIRRLRQLNPDKKVYAVITDIGASGAYYVASAADEIYADPSSMVGSIGVISEGFGFVDVMQKVGIERRMLTAGENKGFMDPFSPSNPKHQAFFLEMLKNVHSQFINAVRDGRGDRLKPVPDMFSGLVWSGEQALGLGLIDGFGSPESVARDVIKQEQWFDYSVKPDPFSAFADRLGVKAADIGYAIMGALFSSQGLPQVKMP